MRSASASCASAIPTSSAASAPTRRRSPPRSRSISTATAAKPREERRVRTMTMLTIPNRSLPAVPRRAHYDAIIVGARCAGASTALLLARAGLRVLAIDRRPYGSDTLSTHALMRPAVLQLSRWGLLEPLLEAGTPLIETTTFHYGDEAITIPLDAGPDLPGLIAPRRTVLDRMLVDAAREAGAEFLHDMAVGDLIADTRGRVRGVEIRAAGASLRVSADIVVGADGIGSLVAKCCNAPMLRHGSVSAAHVYGYAPVEPGAGYHWYFRDGLAGSLIPTNDGQACIVASVPTRLFDQRFRLGHAGARMEVLEALSPALAEQASRAPTDVRLQTFRGVPGFIRQAHGPGWALVGDAGFFRDPITAHGISDALRDAESLARAIVDGSEAAFAAYQRDRDLVAAQILATTDAVAGFDWTLAGIGETHRRLSAIMKAEVQALSERGMPLRRSASRPAAGRTPANEDKAPVTTGCGTYRNRMGARS
ncbi:NAD(P)/FAD-dependent oxidoreductase [Mesorhizobium sp. M3A.F.Ca.ET.080.04.2.1]|nr:NAD(P)/FAD-dependent oxidoreductase [Mesorhizobium sp. M3A.F.Ca.ET.080.04.2.1]PBB85569.1 FAD-binding monooxygenase [Mesorhizobium sp. WSM3876]RWB71805.1 MAG: NAD(P)/FAD-dependent oxidoreductase [Mesorhizobium sp.]TGS62116.1 NAD(P)/FAD-dependent oxidoreductase [Mesorhizobium sp. M3A.F.Ca.ET.201.01.1.1]RWB84942.1 MAG: NAD(P)/FAD-dependent oxidoreductase [Mesorhizobium sp.]